MTWQARIQALMAHLGFSAGLGHHAGRIHRQPAEQAHRPLSLAEVAERTGYQARTEARHLARMTDRFRRTGRTPVAAGPAEAVRGPPCRHILTCEGPRPNRFSRRAAAVSRAG